MSIRYQRPRARVELAKRLLGVKTPERVGGEKTSVRLLGETSEMTDAGSVAVGTPSFMRVDYSLRRAKAIQRKMAVEGLRLLRHFAPFSRYRFVGFGGLRFVDLVLVHQQLGISRMISLEHEADGLRRKRLAFNKPFRAIELRFGTSNALLPELPWRDRTIVWLDYDDRLKPEMLTDVATFAQSAASGSALLISVPVQTPQHMGPEKLFRAFKASIGSCPDPIGVSGDTLDGWGWAAACRRVIASVAADAVAARSVDLYDAQKFDVHQVFNFQYFDSKRMLTLGLVLAKKSDAAGFPKERWCELQWYRETLTIRFGSTRPFPEHPTRFAISLASLPCAGAQRLRAPGLTDEELETFSERVYRHYPLFVEAIA